VQDKYQNFSKKVGNLKEKKTLGRIRSRLEDNIKMDHKN
jgi:hypothetical protein